MFEIVASLPPTDWVRLSLLYAHLLTCAGALALVGVADWRLVSGTFTVEGLRRTARRTTLVLAVLWLSGLALVYRDTGFAPEVLATRPKLLLKLLTVAVLTCNGAVLHALAFPILARGGRPGFPGTLVLALAGALSTSHWLLAAFVGVARPFGLWPFETLLAGYALYCAGVLCVAVLCVPTLRRRLGGVPRTGSDRAAAPLAAGLSGRGPDAAFASAAGRAIMPASGLSSASPEVPTGASSDARTGVPGSDRSPLFGVAFGLALTAAFVLVSVPADTGFANGRQVAGEARSGPATTGARTRGPGAEAPVATILAVFGETGERTGRGRR